MSLLFASIFLTLAVSTPLSAADLCEAQIRLTRDNNLVTVTAICSCEFESADSLDYRMFVRREGPNGSSSSQQSGHFAPKPGRQTLSASSVNITEGSWIEVRLEVLRGKKIIARDHITESFR